MVAALELAAGTAAGPTAAEPLATLPARKKLAFRGGSLSYREAGTGPAIVFLHGLLGCSDSWVFQLRDLSDAYRVVAWDAPGYGASTVVEPDVAVFADALDALLAHLHAEDVSVVGHSMGGVVAAVAAARPATRIRQLVLSCTHPGYGEPPDSPPTAKLLQRIADLEKLGPEAYGRQRARGMVAPCARPGAIELAAQVAAQTRPDGLFSATRALQFADARPCYAQLRARTLVLFGAQDPVVRPRFSVELRRLTPFARHVDLPGVGHAPYLEDPDAYSATIRAFIGGAP